jgi:hypothetical protein
MSTGYSGYSDPAIANAYAATAPPKPPTNFQISSVGLQSTLSPNELAKIIFSFTRPTKSLLTLTEAQSDDIFSNTQVMSNDTTPVNIQTSANYSMGTTSITCNAETTELIAGDIIQFGSETTKYVIDSISTVLTKSVIVLTYELAIAVSINTNIFKCTKTAESPSTSRGFRINAILADSVNIYHDGGDIINKWICTCTLGSFLDKNKILATINEATRSFAKEKVYTNDTTPLLIKTSGNLAIGATLVTLNYSVAGIIAINDYVNFAESADTMYKVTGVSGTQITLESGVLTAIASATQLYKKKLLTDDATPIAYTFTAYDSALLNTFSGDMALDDLGGYKLYMKETSQTEGSKGTLIETILANDTNLVNNSDGTATYTFNAPTTTYDGRLMYFALTAYDIVMPTANESTGDLNAWCITLPGQVNIASISQNTTTLDVTVNYSAITTGSKNPHLLSMMGNNVAPFSNNGGFDIYRKVLTTLDPNQGYYLGIDANNGKYYHPSILLNDMVEIRDNISRHIWAVKAVTAGVIDLSDADLTYGTLLVSYLTGHESINITLKRAAVSSTDTVLPLSSDATPVKQYLTEYQNSYVVTGQEIDKSYCFVMESVDTQISYGKSS